MPELPKQIVNDRLTEANGVNDSSYPASLRHEKLSNRPPAPYPQLLTKTFEELMDENMGYKVLISIFLMIKKIYLSKNSHAICLRLVRLQ